MGRQIAFGNSDLFDQTSMPMMYCPQCGRELDLGSGDVRFCRYCGFSLTDTKEALQGYSEQRRTGFSIVTWSYALLLLVTLLLHGNYIPLNTGWGYWLSAPHCCERQLLWLGRTERIEACDVSKKKRSGKGALQSAGGTPVALGNAKSPNASLPQAGRVSVEQESQERQISMTRRQGSVIEDTTRKLGD